jgi:hypothetical protein
MSYVGNVRDVISTQIVFGKQTASEFTNDFVKTLTATFDPMRYQGRLKDATAEAVTKRLWQFLGDLLLRQNYLGRLEDLFVGATQTSSKRCITGPILLMRQ